MMNKTVRIYKFLGGVHYFYEHENYVYRCKGTKTAILEGVNKIDLGDYGSFDEWMDNQHNYEFVEEVTMNLGVYYPRIGWIGRYQNDTDRIILARATEAFNMLNIKMNSLLLTIHPSVENSAAYGHEIRAMLLLTCMEIENNFVGILKANGIIQDRYSTNDFVKLKDILNLENFEISLSQFPDYPSFKPFSNWTNANPTTSLPWYNAYNKCKHDRDEEFSEGNMGNSLNALGALAALLISQFRISSSKLSNGEFVVINNFNKYEHAFIGSPETTNPFNYNSIPLSL